MGVVWRKNSQSAFDERLTLTGCVQDIDKLLQRTTVASFMENQVLWARYLREG